MVYYGKSLVIQKLCLESTSLCSEKATADIPVVFIDLIDSVLGHLEFGFALETGIFYLNLLKFQQIQVIWQLFECWPREGNSLSYKVRQLSPEEELSLHIVTRFPNAQKLWSGRMPLPGQPGRWHWIKNPALQTPLFLAGTVPPSGASINSDQASPENQLGAQSPAPYTTYLAFQILTAVAFSVFLTEMLQNCDIPKDIE